MAGMFCGVFELRDASPEVGEICRLVFASEGVFFSLGTSRTKRSSPSGLFQRANFHAGLSDAAVAETFARARCLLEVRQLAGCFGFGIGFGDGVVGVENISVRINQPFEFRLPITGELAKASGDDDDDGVDIDDDVAELHDVLEEGADAEAERAAAGGRAADRVHAGAVGQDRRRRKRTLDRRDRSR